MKKLFIVLAAMIYSNLLLAGNVGDGEHYSTPKAITYIIIGVILITVIATVLYKRPKRKFNE